ncbi:diacylglycerol kinase family protein [Candidatus Pacearchaeota archaeon]|nr:diacylglycerol kinase family protein [Candidatus Pacearchaeota archaeon]
MSKVSFITSLKCAIKGIFYGISKQRMLKILLLLGAFAIFSSLLLKISKAYLITILTVVFLVIILELFNNNFERLIDLISPEYRKEFGEIKNTMAGVVLLSFILMVIVASLILYQPMIKLFAIVSKSPISLILILLNIAFIIIILSVHKKKNSLPNNSRINNSPLY